MFTSSTNLHVLSWNACGITSPAKTTSLKAYVYCHHPNVIFIQEAFVGHAVRTAAPTLSGYVSYVHHRNGLITYIHSSVQHRLLRTSDNDNATFQRLEVQLGVGRFVSAMSILPQEG